MNLIAKSIGRKILSSEGRSVWVALDYDAALGLRKTESGLHAVCVLFGSRRKEAHAIFELFKGYLAVRCGKIVALNGEPKQTQLVGLAFDDERHVATLLVTLAKRHFCGSEDKAGRSRRYVPGPYFWQTRKWLAGAVGR